MILQIVDGFLRPLAQFAGFFLFILGIIWIIYTFHEATRRKSFLKKQVEDWDFDITKLLKILTFSGLVVGILAILAGSAGLILNEPPSVAYITTTGNERNLFTCIVLIILGLLTFIKPLNDIPIASMAGILVGLFISILIAFLIPDNAVDFIAEYINPKLLLVIIFVIIFAIVAVAVKFWTAGFMFISKILSWPPLAMIIAIFCFVQGFLLISMGISIL